MVSCVGIAENALRGGGAENGAAETVRGQGAAVFLIA